MWHGSTSPLCIAQHPEYSFLPRIAALELSEPGKGAQLGSDAASGVCGLQRHHGDWHIMLHFTRPDPAAIDLQALGFWAEHLSASAATRVVLSCIPDALVPAASAALVRLGRAATFRERCLTWEPRPGSVCGSGDPAAMLAAAQAALPPGYALDSLQPEEAAMVDLHWKYRCEGVTLVMVQECIASKPSVCVRAAGGVPVCWTVLRSDCSWGLLYTVPEHRRRGLSKAAMLAAFGRQRQWALGLQDPAQRALACAATPYVSGALQGSLLVLVLVLVLPPSLLTPFTPPCAPPPPPPTQVHIARWNEASSGLFRSLDFHPTATATWVISSALAPRYSLRPLRLHCASEVAQLLAHINASYLADDAFFVTQERTTLQSIHDMAAEGVFFVGYQLLPGTGSASPSGLGSEAYPVALASSASEEPQNRLAEAPAWEGAALLVSVYIKVLAPSAGGGRGSAAAEGGGASAAVLPAASPFAADSRQGGGEGAGEPAAAAAAEGASQQRPPSGAVPAGQALAPPVPSGPTASFSLLTVAPQLKHLGVAQRLLEFCLETSRLTYRCAAAEVFIVSVKPWLVEFYRRNGFDMVGAEPWPAFLEHQLLRDCHFVQARRLLQRD